MPSRTNRPNLPPQYRINLSTRSQDHYIDLALKHNYRPPHLPQHSTSSLRHSHHTIPTSLYGVNQVIIALLSNNPHPDNYTPSTDYFDPDIPLSLQLLQYVTDPIQPTVPQWYDLNEYELVRPKVTLYLPTEITDIILTLSRHYSIYDQEGKAPASYKGSRISAVLEAIGHRYLLPQKNPTFKHIKRRNRIKDIAW